MSKEFKSTEEAIILRLGQMVKENVELEQRVHQLMDDYNDVVHQLHGAEKRKEEDPTRQTLSEMRQMRDHCDKLEIENKDLKKTLTVIGSFMENNNLCMGYVVSCPYHTGHPVVDSPSCRECDSYLTTLCGFGVICRKKLSDAKISFTRV